MTPEENFEARRAQLEELRKLLTEHRQGHEAFVAKCRRNSRWLDALAIFNFTNFGIMAITWSVRSGTYYAIIPLACLCFISGMMYERSHPKK